MFQSIYEDIVYHFDVEVRLARLGFLWRILLCGLCFLIAASLTRIGLMGFFGGVPMAAVLALVCWPGTRGYNRFGEVW